MCGSDEQSSRIFSLSPEQRVRADNPLGAIRQLTDDVLKQLSPRFATMHSDMRRPAIPPGQSRRALAGAVALDDSERAAPDGGDRLQHAVSVVRVLEPR